MPVYEDGSAYFKVPAGVELYFQAVDADGKEIRRMGTVTQFTMAFDVTGQPAISLPLFWNEAGLPIGIQLVAETGREDLLFQLSGQLEAARPWSQRRPGVHA